MKAGNRLLRWYDAHGRRLPWRRTRDPYKILVSEIMLQQTQVERVKAYYKAWLELFPDWQTLAKAENGAVLDAWAGLGYNRRALALRDIARQVVEVGEPTTREGWLALKGVGPYTSAAIMAFAFKAPVLPIDTNIRRFAARYVLGVPYPDMKNDKELEDEASVLLDAKRPHDVPQAIFDLSTMHCTKVPDCAACPMRAHCKSAEMFLAGKVEAPQRMVKKANEKIHRNKRYPDRIYRGRILKRVRESEAPLKIADMGEQIDPRYDEQLDRAWLEAMIDRLVKDQMIQRTKQTVRCVE